MLLDRFHDRDARGKVGVWGEDSAASLTRPLCLESAFFVETVKVTMEVTILPRNPTTFVHGAEGFFAPKFDSGYARKRSIEGLG